MHRILLWRRSIDPILLSIAVACFPIKLGLDTVLLAFFTGAGVYLICGWHQSRRLIDPSYATASLAYGFVAIAIGLYHGDVVANLRWIGLPLYFALGIPLFVGFVLIKNPLRQMALGARVGLILTVGMALYESFAGQTRIGLGGNAANAAFVICVLAVIARFHAGDAPRYLPNTRAWFYFAIIPVLMTGTRIVLPIFAIAAIFDLIVLRAELRKAARKVGAPQLALVVAAGVVVVSAAAYETRDIVASRIAYTILEMDNLSATSDKEVTGLDIRINLWQGAIDVAREHLFLGAGGNESMRKIKQTIPGPHTNIYADFVHVHFFALDEIRDRGLVGLVFLLGLFAVIFTRLFKVTDQPMRVNMSIFLILLLLYGSMHGLLLGDRNIAAIVLVFVGVLASEYKISLLPRSALQSSCGSHSSPAYECYEVSGTGSAPRLTRHVG